MLNCYWASQVAVRGMYDIEGEGETGVVVAGSCLFKLSMKLKTSSKDYFISVLIEQISSALDLVLLWRRVSYFRSFFSIFLSFFRSLPCSLPLRQFVQPRLSNSYFFIALVSSSTDFFIVYSILWMTSSESFILWNTYFSNFYTILSVCSTGILLLSSLLISTNISLSSFLSAFLLNRDLISAIYFSTAWC